MISKMICDSDAFLDMPQTTQNLYFHLNLRADDDGFVDNPKKIMRVIGSAQNDLEILLAKRYVLGFQSGVIVIKHWKLHNSIQKDRYKPTVYQEEFNELKLKENGVYTDSKTSCIQNVNKVDPECYIDKNRLDKNRLDKNTVDKSTTHINPTRKMFKPPTVLEVSEYCKERKNGIDPEYFVDHYISNGWMVGKGKMKDWKGCVRTWEKNNFKNNSNTNTFDDLSDVCNNMYRGKNS